MTIAAARASVTAQWLTEARTVVAGLLVDSAGSAPLEPGAVMLIDGEHNVEGTVTGGCVEAAVLAEAQELLAGDRSARLVRYGISDQLAGDVDLMCGGVVHILVQEISGKSAETELAAAQAVVEEHPVVVATLLDGEHAGAKLAVIDGGVTGGLEAGALLDASVARDARGLLDARLRPAGLHAGARSAAADGAVRGDRLLRRTGTDGRRARLCGHHLRCPGDLRPVAAVRPLGRGGAAVAGSVPRHEDAGPRDAVLVLTHDPKFDEPALLAAVNTDAGYIGAMGSRRTVEDRNERLQRAGATEDQLARIFSLCGLDLGARGPEETAISILAEIIAQRTGRGGGHLRDTTTRIHDERDPVPVG